MPLGRRSPGCHVAVALAAAAALGVATGCSREGLESLADGTPAPARPSPPTTGAVEPNATVEFVVDGDTLDVIVDGREERVRLIGIDTPERAHASDGTRPAQPAECFGDQARTYLELLLPVGTPIRLERDVVARDDFGRLLAYVYRAADGVFANYELARHGYAQPLTIPPNETYRELIVEATRQAEEAGAGLWSACSTA